MNNANDDNWDDQRLKETTLFASKNNRNQENPEMDNEDQERTVGFSDKMHSELNPTEKSLMAKGVNKLVNFNLPKNGNQI